METSAIYSCKRNGAIHCDVSVLVLVSRLTHPRLGMPIIHSIILQKLPVSLLQNIHLCNTSQLSIPSVNNQVCIHDLLVVGMRPIPKLLHTINCEHFLMNEERIDKSQMFSSMNHSNIDALRPRLWHSIKSCTLRCHF